MDCLNKAWESRWMAHFIFRPSTYRVDHRLQDINDIKGVLMHYDLLLLDRDSTLQAYHGRQVPDRFKETIDTIAHQSEITSNASYDELRRIRDIFPRIPLSNLVQFQNAQNKTHLLRFSDGKLCVWRYDGLGRSLIDDTSRIADGETLKSRILQHYNKPNPAIIDAVRTANSQTGRVRKDPQTLIVGDRYLTDIAAGNLANLAHSTRVVDTALVRPYALLSEYKNPFILGSHIADKATGIVMSRLPYAKTD